MELNHGKSSHRREIENLFWGSRGCGVRRAMCRASCEPRRRNPRDVFASKTSGYPQNQSCKLRFDRYFTFLIHKRMHYLLSISLIILLSVFCTGIAAQPEQAPVSPLSIACPAPTWPSTEPCGGTILRLKFRNMAETRGANIRGTRRGKTRLRHT